jgi:FkbM family methyltransferase
MEARMNYPAALQLAPINRMIRRGLLGFDYELMLENIYRSVLSEGDFVADVGAHSGRHLFVLAELVGGAGRVAGFEPLPGQYRSLVERAEESATNVTLYNLALSNFVGRSSFVHATGTPEESGLRERTIYNAPDRACPMPIEVAVSTLDLTLADWPRLDYIKLDIEGGELDCLDGAREMIARCRPVISVEFGYPGYSAYGHKPADLTMFARDLDYRIFDIFCIEYWTDADFLENVDGCFWDFFLVPREKRDWFVERVS